MSNQNNQLSLFGASFGPEVVGRLAIKTKNRDDKDPTLGFKFESLRVLTPKEMAAELKLDNSKHNHYAIHKAIVEDGMKLKGSIGAIVAQLQQNSKVIGGKVAQSVAKNGVKTITITLKETQNSVGVPQEVLERVAAAFGCTVAEAEAQLAKQQEAKAVEVAAEVTPAPEVAAE